MSNRNNQSRESSDAPADDSGVPVQITVKGQKEKSDKSEKEKGKKGGLKSHWAIKATVITFFLSAFFSFLSEITMAGGNIIVMVLLLLFLLLGNILFDGIGTAVAACEMPPLLAMASRKVPGAKTAIRLVKNAEVVSNICNDVIGDIFGILTGACTVGIVAKILLSAPNSREQLITIILSSVSSAVLVGGKAVLKNIAINKSKEFVMLTARVITVFKKEK